MICVKVLPAHVINNSAFHKAPFRLLTTTADTTAGLFEAEADARGLVDVEQDAVAAVERGAYGLL